MMVFIFIFMLIGGSLSFVSGRKHILMSLMSLEYLVISFYFGFSLLMVKDISMGYIFLFYLTYSACEGVLGLGVVISLVRGYGNDLFSSTGLVQC